MQRVGTISKDSSFQGHAPKVYTPRALLPYVYCQDGSVVPVIYGIVKIEGNLLYSGADISGGLSAWVGICCGKITLIDIYKNTNEKLIEGIHYTTSQFNDGTGSYKPEITEGGITLSNVSKLSGIAHIFFGGSYKIATNTDNRLPDLRFIAQRSNLASSVVAHTDIYSNEPAVPSGDTWTSYTGMTGRLNSVDGWIQAYHIWTLTNPYVWQIESNHTISAGESLPTKTDIIGQPWLLGTAYTADQIVIGLDNYVYICLQNHTSDYSNRPGDPIALSSYLYWGFYGSTKLYSTITSEEIPEWQNSTVYNINDHVLGSNGQYFKCIVGHTSNATNDRPITGIHFNTYWTYDANAVPPITEWELTHSYDIGDYVYGTDTHVYKCKTAHTSTNARRPITGANWQTPTEYWELVTDRVYRIRIGDIVIGSDGMPYRAIKDADIDDDIEYIPYFPADNSTPLGSDWIDYWEPANGKPWQAGITFAVNDLVVGTDGYEYKCKVEHLSSGNSRPIINSDGTTSWPAIWDLQIDEVFIGNNPAAIAYDILTNTYYGLAIPIERIDFDSFNVAANYYNSKGYGLNFKITDIAEAKQTLNKLLDLVDLILTIGTDGLIQCRVLDPNADPIGIICDDDFSKFTLKKQTWRDIPNEFEATYSEPSRLYEAASIALKNEAAIDAVGGVIKKKTFDLSAFVYRETAFDRLSEVMRRESYPRDAISCEVSGEWYFARPGDLVYINKSEYGISAYYRITRVETGKIDELNISLEMIEAVETIFERITPTAIGRRRLMSPMAAPFTQGELT